MRHDSRQRPLFAVRQFLTEPYPRGSIYDVLARYGGFLFRRSDFPIAERSRGGEVGWCPVLLSALVVLQQKHGWTDRETVRRATVDLQVKACLGMGIEQRGPSQPTLSRHRELMRQLGLDEVYGARLRDLLEALELVGDEEPVLIDSVPIHGAGQQLDTYNLLAGAVRRGLQELAQRQGRSVNEVAAELDLTVYMNRSVKGRFEVDWEDEESRRTFLSQLVSDALSVRRLLVVEDSALPDDDGDDGQGHDGEDDDGQGDGDHGDDGQGASEAADLIDAIVEHDIEFETDGSVKRIRQRAAGDRPISVTDPDMRHGRKSASKLFAGYKAQIVASLMYGFIVLVRVIKANVHDGADLPAIAEEVEGRGLSPSWWGGDHAYGTIANHAFFDTPDRGELIARMARPANGGRFTKDAFDYCFETHTLTCPGGHTVERGQWVTQRKGRRGREFVFPGDSCSACPLREACVKPSVAADKGRSVFIVEDEERLIRRHLGERETPAFKDKLAERPAVERVIAGFAQCGGKHARRMSQDRVAFDSNLSALAYNLRRLGNLLKADEALEARLERALRALSRRLLHWLGRVRRALANCFAGRPPTHGSRPVRAALAHLP